MVDHLPGTAQNIGRWLASVRRWAKDRPQRPAPLLPTPLPPRSIGLALGGGFARGLAHIGVIRVFEQYEIPVRYIAGVSAGAIIAAAYASGSTPDEIAKVGSAMRFTDVARWTLSRMGLAGTERMERFLQKMLKGFRFENMKIPLGVVATDLKTGDPVFFRDHGDMVMPIRASCSYPGLFQPLHYEGKLLVDGGISMEVPALLLRQMGATHVVSIHLPMQQSAAPGLQNMFEVVNRCFQIMQTRTEQEWRRYSDLVLVPDVGGVEWDAFGSCEKLIQAGEIAALEAIPKIKNWLAPPAVRTGPVAASPVLSGSSPAASLSRRSTAPAAAGSPAHTRPPVSPG
jgi:NTE family protein